MSRGPVGAAILRSLEAAIAKEGVAGLAARAGVTPSLVSRYRAGRSHDGTPLPPQLLRALGWARVVTYRRTTTRAGGAGA